MQSSADIAQAILQDRAKGSSQLVAEYRERLYAVAFSLCRDAAEAEDLVFRTIERVLDRIETYQEQDSFYDWMCVILLNLYRDSRRGKTARGTVPVGGASEMEPIMPSVGADMIIAAVDADIARRALEKIPAQMREVLILHYFMDMSVRQIARTLLVPTGTVMSRLHYARIALAHRLGVKLKKPAVALIAAGLLLLGATASVVFSVGGRKELVAPESSAAHAHGNDLKSIDMCDSFLASSTTTTEEITMNRLLTVGAAVAAAAYTPVTRAEISYSYENDNKTLVVTVDSGTWWLQDDQYQAALNNNTVTNLVKRGAGAFGVNGTARNFTGDVRIENGQIQMRSTNPLGTKGRVYVSSGKAVVFDQATVEKDIVTEPAGSATNIYVWSSSSRMNGKLLIGNSAVYLRAYAGAALTFNGGVANLDTGGWPYFTPSGGATFTFATKPFAGSNQFYFNPQVSAGYPVDSAGFAGYFVFAAPSNMMSTLGWDTGKADGNYRINNVKVSTTADWAFDKLMTVYMGHDSVFDLCGTEQRFGQFDVKVPTGNPSVITNSAATPATLHMGMMYGPSSSAANIRFGGNLSVVFENNIWETKVNYPMTAKGNLIIKGNGPGGANSAILNFMSDGSWANATNVVVEGVGKIKIANPNALGKKTNLSLASNSSLEISSGVAVTVRTLTVGGVQKPNGNYMFGSGTLRVFTPGLVVRIH